MQKEALILSTLMMTVSIPSGIDFRFAINWISLDDARNSTGLMDKIPSRSHFQWVFDLGSSKNIPCTRTPSRSLDYTIMRCNTMKLLRCRDENRGTFWLLEDISLTSVCYGHVSFPPSIRGILY